SVIVQVGKKRSQSVVGVFMGDSGLGAHIGKTPIAVIMKKVIGFAQKTARAAHHLHPAKLTGGERDGRASRNRRMIEVVMYVAGDKQVESPVVVVIAEGRA